MEPPRQSARHAGVKLLPLDISNLTRVPPLQAGGYSGGVGCIGLLVRKHTKEIHAWMSELHGLTLIWVEGRVPQSAQPAASWKRWAILL